MRAGLLDRQLTVQKRGEATDATYGAVQAQWSEFARVWAQVEELTGRELLRAGILQAQLTLQVTMRYLPGLNASMRLVDEFGRVLQITSVAMSGRRAWHILQCEETNVSAG